MKVEEPLDLREQPTLQLPNERALMEKMAAEADARSERGAVGLRVETVARMQRESGAKGGGGIIVGGTWVGDPRRPENLQSSGGFILSAYDPFWERYEAFLRERGRR